LVVARVANAEAEAKAMQTAAMQVVATAKAMEAVVTVEATAAMVAGARRNSTPCNRTRSLLTGRN
jgi:hypothetical protein